MAADAWAIFHGAKEKIGDGTFDLDTHTFKVALLDSGWTPSLSADAVWADISANDLGTAFGFLGFLRLIELAFGIVTPNYLLIKFCNNNYTVRTIATITSPRTTTTRTMM